MSTNTITAKRTHRIVKVDGRLTCKVCDEQFLDLAQARKGCPQAYVTVDEGLELLLVRAVRLEQRAATLYTGIEATGPGFVTVLAE